MKLLSIPVLIGLLLVSVASGDVIHMKDGRKIEGTVVEKTDAKVVVQTKFGVSEFKASEVDRIEKKSTPKEEYKQRMAEAKGDADALYKVYIWAKGNGLASDAKRALREVVKADPDHENARKLLGYVKFEDRWVTESEKERLVVEAERKEMEAKGLVRFKGEWVTKEEKERLENEAKGLVLVDGKWVNKREYERAAKDREQARERAEKRAQGLFEVNGKWVAKAEAEAFYADLNNPYRADGENVYLYTNKGIDFGDKMLVGAEAAYRDAAQLFGREPEGGKKLHVFVVATLEDFNSLGNAFNADEQSSNFYEFGTPWLPENDQGFDLVTVTQYNQADSLTELYVRHAVAEQFVRRLIGPEAADPAPRWFVDGVSAYLSRFNTPKLYSWSRDRLLSLGGILKLKNHFRSYQPNEQYILGGGILIAWLKSGEAPEEVAKEFESAMAAVAEGKKVSKAFRGFEKALTKAEDSFRDHAEM